MTDTGSSLELQIFSTAPQSAHVPADRFLGLTRDVARWSEAAGCTGILVYTDNRLVDPWLVSQTIIESTERLCPLVATQPVYMHPYSVAKMIASFGFLYGRKIFLNMVAGGFKNDLDALGDPTPHDERYARLTEYTSIILRLLEGAAPVSLEGRYYTISRLAMKPALPEHLRPGILLSGSSPAGQAAARELGAIAVEYPKPGDDYGTTGPATGPGAGVRVGIIADPDGDRAWAIARERFPEDRRGQIAQQLAMKVSDSQWHRQLAELGREAEAAPSPYWLWPFQNYSTFCPYLVGSDETVSDELAKYIRAGFRVFILDIPTDPQDLAMTGRVFDLARKKAAR